MVGCPRPKGPWGWAASCQSTFPLKTAQRQLFAREVQGLKCLPPEEGCWEGCSEWKRAGGGHCFLVLQFSAGPDPSSLSCAG